MLQIVRILYVTNILEATVSFLCSKILVCFYARDTEFCTKHPELRVSYNDL